MLKSLKRSAFTLIELAIIIAIIGVMSAVAITQMMDLSGSAEEAVLEDYLQKLNTGVAQFMAANGRRPDGFGEFVAALADLDAASGLTVPTLVAKNGQDMCGVPGAAETALTCAGAGLRARNATYDLTNGTITLTITAVGGAGADGSGSTGETSRFGVGAGP
jgi:type II secretory pathway pseudopilin PulG